MPLRSIRLPRDRRQCTGDHPPFRRPEPRGLGRRAETGDDDALATVRRAGRALGGAIAHLVGALDVRHITLVGTVTTLGEPWLDAVRDEATSRSLAATGQETTIETGGAGDDVTLLGACALLLTRELGLTVHR